MTDEFDPARSRAKRALPFWVDAWHRDTQHLDTEMKGAYLMLLFAMWARPSLDLPDHDKTLRNVCGISATKWRRGFGATMRAFLEHGDGVVWSKKLREVADYVEANSVAQHSRSPKKESKKSHNIAGKKSRVDENEKPRQKSRKTLKSNEPHKSADIPTDNPVDDPPRYPVQGSKSPSKKEEDSLLLSYGEEDFEEFFEELWKAFPHRGGVGQNRDGCREIFREIVGDDGPHPEVIIRGARSYAETCARLDKIPRSPTTWLNQRGWADDEAKPATRASRGTQIAFYADLVNSDRYLPLNTISPGMARELVEAGLVTPERLRERGIH